MVILYIKLLSMFDKMFFVCGEDEVEDRVCYI